MRSSSVVLSRLLLVVVLVPAAAVADSIESALVPASETASLRASFVVPLDTIPIVSVRLNAPDPTAVRKIRRANSASGNKPLQIGVGRDVVGEPAAASRGLLWQRAPNGFVAHWEVASPDAHALRIGLRAEELSRGVELRFAGRASPVVYGPFSAADVTARTIHWSPVLAGESAIVEIFKPDEAATTDISIAQISHFLANPSEPNADRHLKDGSGACEVDLICRSASDPALAAAGRSVAKMVYQVASGNSFQCTGTLLNSSDNARPAYFYTTEYCIPSQAVADTVTTHWFYDRTGCGSGSEGPNYVQLTGGAQLAYANRAKGLSLLRLARTPPAGAVYAGWDSSTLPAGTALTGIHHPFGDWKKVSVGTMSRFVQLEIGNDILVGSTGESFFQVDWTSGVTEQGSAGSGVFASMGDQYYFRGGLYGGDSACNAAPANMNDWYTRFDLIYPSIRQFLNPSGIANQVVVEYLNTTDFPSSPGGHFFYSSDPAEQAAVDAGAAGAFARTNRQFFTGGTSPVCRFYGSVSPGPNSHFFTVDTSECNALRAVQVTPPPATLQQWNYEGISYQTTPAIVAADGTRSCPANTQPLYRAYNNAFPPSGPRNPWDSNHRFTPVLTDIAAMVSQGWRDEGIVFCTALCASCLRGQ